MKKRILSFIMACFMVVSTFIISKPFTRVQAVEYKEGENMWTLPMDWSTGLKQSADGWDLAQIGQWRLTSFSDLSTLTERVGSAAKSYDEVAALEKAASNKGGLGPIPYIESARNAEATQKTAVTNWYVNYGNRWGTIAFNKGDNDTYMIVTPRYRGGSSYTNPTVVFTAPTDGVYSYSELVSTVLTAKNFSETVNGETVNKTAPILATATVRKNGAVINAFAANGVQESKTLTGEVVLRAGDSLMFAFSLNCPAADIADYDQVFKLGSTVVRRIGDMPTGYKEVDHSPVFSGESATSTSGNVVLKGYDLTTKEFYDLTIKDHPDPAESGKWLAIDPKAKNTWENATTDWSEREMYAHLWGGTKNGALTMVGGSHAAKTAMALVFTAPHDGNYALYAELGYKDMLTQPTYSDYIITVNGVEVFSRTNYVEGTTYRYNNADALEIFWSGNLKADDEVVIMKAVRDDSPRTNTSNNGVANVQITEFNHVCTNEKYETSKTEHWKVCDVGCGEIPNSRENHTYGNDTVCDECEYDIGARLTGLSLALNKGVTVKVKLAISEEWFAAHPDDKVVFSNSTTLEAKAGVNEYTVTLKPTEINDALTVTYGNVEAKDVSVAKYAELAKGNNDKLDALLTAIVNYGKAADMEDVDVSADFIGVNDAAVVDENEVFGSMSANLGETASIKFRFNEATGYTYAIANAEDTLATGSIVDNQLVIENIFPSNYNDEYVLTVKNGEEAVATVTFTFNAYLKALNNTEGMGAEVQRLIAAVYQYGLATEAYNAQ